MSEFGRALSIQNIIQKYCGFCLPFTLHKKQQKQCKNKYKNRLQKQKKNVIERYGQKMLNPTLNHTIYNNEQLTTIKNKKKINTTTTGLLIKYVHHAHKPILQIKESLIIEHDTV